MLLKKTTQYMTILMMAAALQSCGGYQSNSGDKSAAVNEQGSELPAGDLVAGKAAYATSCASCHGPLDTSSKKGRDLAGIQWAITNIPQMNSLTLPEDELRDIALALLDAQRGGGEVETDLGRLQYACDPSLRSKTPMLKLTNREFRVALIDVLNSIDPNLRNDATLNQLLNGLPQDTVRVHSTSQEQALLITREMSNRYFEVAYQAATLVTNSSSLGSYLGSNTCLADAALTEACHRSFVQTLASRAFRRTVDAAEAQQLAQRFWDSTLPKNQQLILTFTSLTQMPDFLYKPFDRGTLVAGTTNTYTLTSEELAAKLSFFLVGAPPDSELRSLARSGALNDPQVLSQQFDRLISRPEARATIIRFFRESLGYEITSDLVYPDAFRNGIATSGLAQAMTDEMDQLFTQVTLNQRGTFQDLFTSRYSSVADAGLAAIYGVSPGTGITLPVERSGYLNRASFLTKRSGVRASPIKRGFAIIENTLCINVGSPPPSAPTSLPDLNGETLSTRQLTHRTSEAMGTTCVNCHSRINPLGYAFEGFDSLGRTRLQETIFDSNFNITARVSIDTGAVTSELGRQVQSFANSVDLSAQIGRSDRAMMCFVKNLKRFESRVEPSAADYCHMNQALQTLYGSGTNPGSIVDALKSLVMSQHFKTWSH